MSTNPALRTVKTLTDETIFQYHKHIVNDETMRIADHFNTPMRLIPNSVGCKWYIHHQPPENPFDDDILARHVKMTVHFTKFVRGKITIEVKDRHQLSEIKTQTHKFERCKSFQWHYMLYFDMLNAVNQMPRGILEMKWTIEVETEAWFMPKLPWKYENFIFEDPDFQIVCGTEEVQTHKEVLRKISPIFANMLSSDSDEKNSGKFTVDGFDVETVQTAFDVVYGKNLKILTQVGKPSCRCNLSVELVLQMLYFADKYGIKGIFDPFEQVPMYNFSIPNFCLILRYADDCSKPNLLARCALFFKRNYENIKTTDSYTKLPGQLKIKLFQAAYKLATVYDVIEYAFQNGICIGLEGTKLPSVTNLDDFLKCIPYASKYPDEDLQDVCAKFWQENKPAIQESPVYQGYSSQDQFFCKLLDNL